LETQFVLLGPQQVEAIVIESDGLVRSTLTLCPEGGFESILWSTSMVRAPDEMKCKSSNAIVLRISPESFESDSDASVTIGARLSGHGLIESVTNPLVDKREFIEGTATLARNNPETD